MTRKDALVVAKDALRECFLAAGFEMVHTMPSGGDQSDRHDKAVERIQRISEAAPVIDAMIEEEM